MAMVGTNDKPKITVWGRSMKVMLGTFFIFSNTDRAFDGHAGL